MSRVEHVKIASDVFDWVPPPHLLRSDGAATDADATGSDTDATEDAGAGAANALANADGAEREPRHACCFPLGGAGPFLCTQGAGGALTHFAHAST